MKVIGLDLGTNSLGWAVVEKYPNENYQLLNKGVRIFQEGVKNEKGSEISRAAERTTYRSARRLKFRRKIRKVNVLRILKTEIDGAINETISHTKEIYPETKVELKDSILEALAIELSLLDKFKFETKQKIFNELKPQIEKTVNDMQDKDSMITEIKHSLNCETLRSGFIETSNINMVSEMTNLIETNRLLEMYQKVMSSQNDDMNRDAITKLAPTKG